MLVIQSHELLDWLKTKTKDKKTKARGKKTKAKGKKTKAKDEFSW